MNKLKRKQDDRPRAFWGALISAGVGIINSINQAERAKKEAQRQANIQDYNNLLTSAPSISQSMNTGIDYQQNYLNQFKQQARLGITKRLGGRNIMITDGGNAKRIGNNTYLLRGGSHEDINETGQTGIGINVGGNEIEAEGGEVAQRKGNSLRIYSAQPILGGMSPAQAIMRGYNKDKVFNAQQRFKKNNDINDDGSKAQWGMGVGTNRALQKSTKNGTRSIRSMWNSAKGPLSYTPIVGTAIDGYNLITNPSKTNAFNFGVGLASDLLGYKWLKGVFDTPVRRTVFLNHRGRVPSKVAAGAYSVGAKALDTEMNYLQNKKRYGGLTSKDRGSSKHPYPSVSSKDFAGGNRSYPIPTKADAIDALRLAGLHGRSDVKAKVYSRYPELRKKAAFGDWVRTNRDDNVLANLLYESGLFDRESWKTALRDIHDFTGMGGDPYNTDENVDAVMTPAFGSSSTRILSQLSKSPEASYTLKQVLGLPTKEMVRKRIAGDIAKRIGVARAARQSSNFRNYNIARMQAANAEGSFSPFANQVRYAEGKPVLVNTNGYYTTARNTISRNAKNMTSGTNPFLYAPKTSDEVLEGLNRVITSAKQGAKKVGQKVGNKFKGTPGQKLSDAYYGLTPMQRAKLKGLTLAATLSVPAGYFVESQNGRNNKTVSVQKDAHGKPISQYIARPQAPAPVQAPAKQPSRTQVKKAVPTQKDTVIPRQIKKVVPQKSNTVPSRVNTTPQYKGNVTKGNYQLHDGETRTINGIKYTRRGNTIINHKTNVGYIYDKRGNYTGQADYSKLRNFNQAFDAARAAGRSQFIYRAGKYQNYSTNKETDAKKEALNRRVGARRIAKRMGGLTNPPVGSRRKYLPGGTANPWDEYKVPDYGGTAPWQISNRYDVNIPYPIGKHDLPITTITAKKDTFNDEMSRRMRAGVQNLKDSSDTNGTVPYLGRQSSFKPTTQDYIGLGIDTLASLGIGLINSNAAGKTYLPERPAMIQASKLPTYYNVAPEVEEVKRQRDILTGQITNNTSSSVAALNRISRIRGNATGEINKLYATKENEENKMLTQDALNQQQVAAENVKLQADYENNKANILNAASQAKASALSGTLSGLSQAWTNFAGSVENRYDARQNEIAAISSANSPSVVKNAISLGYNLSPEVLANLYNSSKNDELRNAILGRLSPYERKRYGIE